MMRMISRMIALAVLAAPAAAMAENPAAPTSATDERRLSPAQVEAVLAEAAAKRAAPHRPAPADTAIADEDVPAPAPQVHGEVGFTIGTGGYREAYGTAIYPLKEGIVAISLDFTDWGRRR